MLYNHPYFALVSGENCTVFMQDCIRYIKRVQEEDFLKEPVLLDP